MNTKKIHFNKNQELLSKVQKDGKINVKYYIELFSVSLKSFDHNLKKVNPETIVINDKNDKFINFYTQIQKDPERVFEGYKMIEDKFNSLILEEIICTKLYPKNGRKEIEETEKLFYYIREYINTGELDYVHAACLLFLQNHGFNNNYIENKKGFVNVSFNWSTKPINLDKIKNYIYSLSQIFNSKKVVFENLSVDKLIKKYNEYETFIHIEPSYSKRKQDNILFNDEESHKNLLNSLSKFKYIMYSNFYNIEHTILYDGFVEFKKSKSKNVTVSYKINKKVPVNTLDYIPTDNEYNFKLGTCFSGLGCPEYVLKQLKIPHTTEFVCDINKFCRETLIKNYNPKKVFEDITKLTIKDLPNTYLDCYIWGSPCQDLSQSKNNRQGLKGEKSKLFYEGYRILKETQPKYSIFENVPGLLSSNNGEDFKEVIRLFEELGNYDIYWKKINPVEIGGNTTRVRVFVILIRKDIGIKFNFPKNTGTTKSIKDCLIDGEYKYYDKSEYIPWERPIEKQRGKLKKDYKLINISRQEQSRVFNIEYPSPTIQRSGVVHINDGKGVRLLSCEELKKVQGFGDDLDFSHLSNTQIKSQLGNTMEFETMKKLMSEIIRIDKTHYNRTRDQELKKVS